MKVIIIGAVATGLSAAYQVRRHLPEAVVTVLEKQEDISYGACGFPYFIEGLIREEKSLIARDKARVLQDGIDLRTGWEVTAVDVQKKTVTAKVAGEDALQQLPYDRLVIAVGGKSKRIAGLAGMKGVFPLNTLQDAREIKAFIETRKPKSAVVIGGGNKGVELLEALIHRKISARLVEYLPRILGFYDEEVSRLLLERLQKEGHALHTGEKVLQGKTDQEGYVTAILTDRGEYPAELVIETVGVEPNTDFLEGTGINREKGAIITDLYGRTNVKDVYAGGDCAMIYNALEGRNIYMPLGTNANKAGKLIGLAIAGIEPGFRGSQVSSMVRCFGYELGRSGVNDDAAAALGWVTDSVLVRTKNKSSYYPGSQEMYVKLTYLKEDGKLVGAQVFGPEGTALRIQGLAVAIYAGLKVQDLEYLDFGYIPPLNSPWDSINVAAGKATAKMKRK
ncbi:FAD-dependent oxidoreductase [Proteiniclasticum sp. BAD-10]|uniref:FAD-dependent oxidoreductase n=1 Tax=Proteiniclasticum sediminis TaxID=2804028 RepID=A0A941HNQ7_9CLOT|nr:FAD-dependent oxidoreductase [Proteiniclasticum sediminis]MBR0574721.1 FAD-dependent oxidoreductase [Proteiniclasticum sediminis]